MIINPEIGFLPSNALHSPKKNNLIGLTGRIGSGKTLVASIFAEAGVDIIDTDKMAHQITAVNGIAMHDIRDEFGAEFITKDGALDRDKMRDLIFSDTAARDRLGDIVYPLIYEAVLSEVLLAKSLYIIIVVPLLFSSTRYQDLVAHSIFVDCPDEILIKRVQYRSGLSPSAIESILSHQASRERQLKLADDVIDNSQDELYLRHQVQILNTKYMDLFK